LRGGSVADCLKIHVATRSAPAPAEIKLTTR